MFIILSFFPLFAEEAGLTCIIAALLIVADRLLANTGATSRTSMDSVRIRQLHLVI